MSKKKREKLMTDEMLGSMYGIRPDAVREIFPPADRVAFDSRGYGHSAWYPSVVEKMNQDPRIQGFLNDRTFRGQMDRIRKQYLVLNRTYDREQFKESMAVAALFHDLCKVNCYKVRISGKNNMNFVVDEQLPFGGHGSKSVYMLSKYLKDVRDEEAIAINCHMGFSRSEDNSINISESFRFSLLAWIIHVADEAATFMLDRITPQ